MAVTIRDRIDARDTGLVGRAAERDLLRGVLGDDGPLVIFVHGIGGAGKSALLDAFARESRTTGAAVVPLDGGEIEPTRRGFLSALATTLGTRPGDRAELDDLGERVGAAGDRVVITIDRYEAIQPIDPWIRGAFVPALGDHVRLVVAGREAPVAAWALDLGPLFRRLELGSLPRSAARALLRRDGVADRDLERIERLARGHALSLRLAAAAIRASPTHDHEALASAAIGTEFTSMYLAALDAPTRQALDAACVVRRPTQSLLGAMLPGVAPDALFERLRGLPFAALESDGLVIHDTVREVVATELRARDPERSRRHRIAAWRRLRTELVGAPASDMWRYTADLLYLLENATLREEFFPTTARPFTVDDARADEWAAIRRLAVQQYPGASIADVEAWWAQAPWAFRVARDGANTPVGFSAAGPLDRVPRALVDLDPVARRWRDDERRDALPLGTRAWFQRFERADPDDPADRAVHAALLLDLHRAWMEVRPALRRHYGCGRDVGSHPGGPVPLVRQAMLPSVMAAGVVRLVFRIDFGPGSVDGWLADLIATELQVEDGPVLDIGQHQFVLDGRRVDLTTLEFALVRYLHDRRGIVVGRAALLRDVWGDESGIGSNVVEAVVTSVRRKLGDQARSIQTVRGSGYRFVASA